MRCPSCGDEFEDHVTRCPDCLVDLQRSSEVEVRPPTADALLGRFHPHMATRIVQLLQHRRVLHDPIDLGDVVEILVSREFRDDLRSELVVNWSEFIHRLPTDEKFEVLEGGGDLPGWMDAPSGVWIDREGRLQVADSAEAELEADARRTIGPGLAVAGLIALLLGWYIQGGIDDLLIVGGIAAVIVGVLLPR